MRKKIMLYLSEDGTKLLQALAQELGIENKKNPGTWSASGAVEHIISLIRERGAQAVARALQGLKKEEG